MKDDVGGTCWSRFVDDATLNTPTGSRGQTIANAAVPSCVAETALKAPYHHVMFMAGGLHDARPTLLPLPNHDKICRTINKKQVSLN